MQVSLQTLMADAGTRQERGYGDVSPAIHMASTYERTENLDLVNGHSYSRCANPSRSQLEATLATAEGGATCLAFSSGMAAATAILLTFPQSYLILCDDCYHGVPFVACTILRDWGQTVVRPDASDATNIEAALCLAIQTSEERRPILVWTETPSNPMLKVTNLESVASVVRHIRDLHPNRVIMLVCDNTWATPVLTRPIVTYGFDIVLQSLTKYIGGHSDLVAGAVVLKHADNDVSTRIRDYQQQGGAVCGPFEAWLALRGLRSLHCRMSLHCSNAMEVAVFLSNHARIDRVYYPGLPSHPNHDIAKIQMGGRFGGMMSFTVKPRDGDDDGCVGAKRCVCKCRLITRATSLGGTESLIEHRRSSEGPYGTSPMNLIRFSVGLEDVQDLIRDLSQALSDD